MTSGLTNHATGGDPAVPGSGAVIADAAASELNVLESADSWRVEVAARLEHYRTRRKPRAPRYPSLLLPFDAPESWSRPSPPTGLAGTGSAGIGASAYRAKPHVPYPGGAEGRRDDKLRRTLPDTDAKPRPISGAGPGTIRGGTIRARTIRKGHRVPTFGCHSGVSPQRTGRSRFRS